MAQEFSHTIKNSKNKKHEMAAIKIDMSKAFDRVRWKFLFHLLEKLKFPPHWIQLIKECVTTVQYSVIVNGQISKPFIPKCGLRQDDSYFFVHLNQNSINFFSTTISIFCKDSGQIINYHKSTITFSLNTPSQTRSETLSTLGIMASDTFGSYLGIAMDITTSRKQIFVNIADKSKEKSYLEMQVP
ncbi:hypothetical protein LIER_25853 [Lithospermum erythrorhizon]|uniref:Reverse transcriptase domain-containing protein n=1 Tax=Lithospermum erythrorhizon TaxID=34254 RepID=A0AAV3RC87_LITER